MDGEAGWEGEGETNERQKSQTLLYSTGSSVQCSMRLEGWTRVG